MSSLNTKVNTLRWDNGSANFRRFTVNLGYQFTF